jgi:hypothetical protein
MSKMKGKMGRWHKAGTGNIILGLVHKLQENILQAISTPGNQLVTTFTAPLLSITSLATVARMQPPVQKAANTFDNHTIKFADIPPA